MTSPDEGSERSRRFHLGTWIMVLLLIAVGAAAVGAYSWRGGLRVREIQTQGNRILSRSDLLALAAIPKQQKLFDLDLNAVCSRVEQNTFVRSASAVRDVSGRITIIVEERSPIAALVADRLLYIDADGVVLPAVRSEYIYDLPLLTGAVSGGFMPGRKITAAPVTEALDLLVTARSVSDELYRGISEVHIQGDGGMLLYTAENGVPVIVGRGDLPAKLAKLDAFWKEFVSRRGAQELTYIDLRFEDQVVVRWQPQAALQAQ